MPLRVVPSSTGFPSKRCPGIGFFSRADREIGVFQHVAPPTRLRLELPRETGLILRCAGKVGNPLQTEQWSRPSFRNQERSRGSDEVVPGTSLFPSSESVMSRNFWGRIKGAKYRFALQDGTWDFSGDAVADKGPHLAMTREARGFSRVSVGFSSYDGEFRLPLVLAQQV